VIGALLVGLGLMLVLLGWGLSGLAVGPDRDGGGRLGTAARALPWGMALAGIGCALGRLYALAKGVDPGAALGVPLSVPPTAPEVVDGFGRLAAALGGALLAGTVGRALSKRGRRERARMGWTSWSDAGGAMLAGLLGAASLVLFAANPVALGTSIPLDLAALTPLVALALAIHLGSRRLTPLPPMLPALPEETETPDAGDPDPVGLLQAEGLLDWRPEHTFAAQSAGPTESSLRQLWEAAGGRGAPPGALGPTIERVATYGALVIPDVPGHTEEALLAAVLLGALGEQGGRAFVVGRDPVGLRDRVARGFEALACWPPGALVADASELKSAGDHGRLPAAIFATPEVANSVAVPWMAHGDGEEFARQLGCVVLSRPDLLDAVRSAHLYFTLARLRLFGREGGPRAAVVTANGTDEILRAVNTMLGTAASRVPLRLPRTEQVRIHRGLVPGGETSRDAVVRAVRRAWAILEEAGVPVTLEDAAELLSADDLGRDRTRIELDAPGSLRGDCTLMVVADDQVGPVFRVAAHRPPGRQPWGQVVVWWVLPGPVANFLLEPGRLALQAAEGILPAPTPLFARDNGHLSRLHLLAALHEGSPEEELLRRAFGASRVSALIDDAKARRIGDVAEMEAGTGAIRRSSVLAPHKGQQRPDTSRRTMTAAAVRVVDGTVGEELDRVDQLTAATHYYPHRVFGSRGRRYRVPPGGGFDRGSATITVEPVGNDLEPTVPDLVYDVTLREWLGERDQRSDGGLVIQAGDARVVVVEEVSRALSVVGSSWSRFEHPVSARYSTEIKVLWLAHHGRLDDRWEAGLRHVARLLDDVLIAWLRCRDENIDVVPRIDGWGGIESPALLVIDRHVGGAGVADALTLPTLLGMLKWVRAIMVACPCDTGCARCTPPEVLDLSAKNDAIGLLGT